MAGRFGGWADGMGVGHAAVGDGDENAELIAVGSVGSVRFGRFGSVRFGRSVRSVRSVRFGRSVGRSFGRSVP